MVDANGNVISTEKEEVLKRWKEDFEKLYAGGNDPTFDLSAKDEILQTSVHSVQPHSAADLNKPISYSKVVTAVNQSKPKKACGVDLITNELLKTDEVIELLHGLFTMCFRKVLIPDTWRMSIINPIPKAQGFPPDPLKYRGLALQSCIYKIFSAIMNRCLMTYLESENILEEEQNGFQGRRSCLQHIFALQTITRNKCQSGSIFASFFDFRKAFNSIDRDLLFY